MKLLRSFTSPFARKCRITALEVDSNDRCRLDISVFCDGRDCQPSPNPLNLFRRLFETDEMVS